MRTLQEKYNAIQEGNFSKDQFLRDARMQHPNLVTQYNGYTDAVQILKNRGMISEVKLEEARLTKNSLTDYRYKPTNDMDKYPYEQILRGLRVELEGLGVTATPTPEEYKKALAKVLKNLEKDEIFYTNQIAGNNKKVDLHDKMVDATAKNTVDTFNGMKKVKDLNEDVLKEGIKNLIKKALMENEEDVYEMHGPKSDDEYKSQLADYLEGHQIYGYTNKIHNLMTGPDEDQSIQDLADFLQDNQIYGYNKGIEIIYADYPYDQHYMNQDDEDESEELPKEIPGFEGTRDALDNLFESKSLKDLL